MLLRPEKTVPFFSGQAAGVAELVGDAVVLAASETVVVTLDVTSTEDDPLETVDVLAGADGVVELLYDMPEVVDSGLSLGTE